MSNEAIISFDEVVRHSKSSLLNLKSLKSENILRMLNEREISSDNASCDWRIPMFENTIQKIEMQIENEEIILQLYDFLRKIDGEREELCIHNGLLSEENQLLKNEVEKICDRLLKSEKTVCQLKENVKHLQVLQAMKEVEDPQRKGHDSLTRPVSRKSKICFYHDREHIRKAYRGWEMSSVVDLNEQILEAWKYKTPSTRFQLTDFVFNHQFIVFRTNDYYWSVDMGKTGVDVQKAELKQDVRNTTCSGQERIRNVTQLEYTKGRMTVGALMNFVETIEVREDNELAHEVFLKLKYCD